MKFFADTADIAEIEKLADSGLIDGVTTNPSLIAQSGRNFLETVKEICKITDGHVSAEVAATDYETMQKEADKLAALAANVAVKVPLTPAGLKVCRNLRQQGIAVNVTLCFSANQALLAAKAGASYISPFIGRVDDMGYHGMSLIKDICDIYDNYKYFSTEVLAASIRSPLHIYESAKAGAHVATCPPKVIWQLFNHPLTDKGLNAFTEDWKKTGQSIL